MRRFISSALFGTGMILFFVGGFLAPIFDYAERGGKKNMADVIYSSSLGVTSEHQSDAEVAPTLDEEGCAGLIWEGETGLPAGESEYVAERLSFSVRTKGRTIPYSLKSNSLMPRESVELEAVDPAGSREFSVTADQGDVEGLGPNRWRWRVPERPGMGCVRIARADGEEAICINAFVMRPYDGSEILNGYRIGRYQGQPLNDDPAYDRPRGLIEITPELEEAWVSPHFQLRQFVCKQEGGYPKYLVLQTDLLMKLELLLEELNRRGIPASSLYIVSGYRTPWYNAEIGNETTYSRHTYGDAADVLVDTDRNGVFDDLDGRGEIGAGDVLFLQRVVDRMESEGSLRDLVGGFGLYEPIPGVRGPFAHIDVRGRRARWVVAPGEEDEEDSIEAVVERDTLLKEEERGVPGDGSGGAQTSGNREPGEMPPVDTGRPPSSDALPSEERTGRNDDFPVVE